MDDAQAMIDDISDENLGTAQALKDEMEIKVSMLKTHHKVFRQGCVDGTRELVIRSNNVVVYLIDTQTISILRVLHAAQQWP